MTVVPHRLIKAITIAKTSLRSCYFPDGIVAGTHHFTDYWARDGYFAAFGSLIINDKNIVLKQINNFLSFQRDDGLIPYRIMRGPVNVDKYLGKPKTYPSSRPTYRLRGYLSEVYDGTTLTLLTLANYCQEKFLPPDQYLSQINQALKYLTKHERYDLLWDGVMAEWNDTAYKWGNLFYSNLIYWKMYQQLSKWTKDPAYEHKANKIANFLYERFFNGQFFCDWFDYKRHDYFTSFGNLLAITWGLTTPKQSVSILTIAHKNIINFTLETNFPTYPWWRIDVLHHVVGMGNYQNHHLLWWQPACAYVAALSKVGRQTDAMSHLNVMAEQINRYQGIYECYERNNRPVKRWLYQAEKPFAWSAGLFLWAVDKVYAASKYNWINP